jgi:death on curing protein
MFYLTAEDVTAIHGDLMARMGSPPAPLLHPDKLDSAVNRPRQLGHYEPGADLFAQAVSLAVGISQAQAFQDGNKRAAYAAADSFVIANGFRIDGHPLAFASWLICVAGHINDDDLDVVVDHLGLDLVAELDAMGRESICRRFEDWLRENASPQDPFELIDREP